MTTNHVYEVLLETKGKVLKSVYAIIMIMKQNLLGLQSLAI